MSERITSGALIGGAAVAAASRSTPVEELVAVGFGTAIVLEEQTATWPLAVAVWDGTGGNRGGRTHHARFTPMAVES